MSITDKATLDAAIEILSEAGIRGLGYTFSERKPTHLDAWYLRVNRLTDVHALCGLMMPFSITKQKQWALAREWCELRLAGASLDVIGRVSSRGPNTHAWTAREIAIHAELAVLNHRGREIASGEG